MQMMTMNSAQVLCLCQHVPLHYIQSGTKSRQGSEFGTIQHPGRHCNFSGTGRQNFGIFPAKLGHLNYTWHSKFQTNINFKLLWHYLDIHSSTELQQNEVQTTYRAFLFLRRRLTSASDWLSSSSSLLNSWSVIIFCPHRRQASISSHSKQLTIG